MTIELLEQLKFWKTKIKYSEDEERTGEFIEKITINQLQFCQFLQHYGFIRHDIQEETIFCRITNEKVIKPVTITEMMDFTFDWIESLNEQEDFDIDQIDGRNLVTHLSNKMLTGVNIWFNKQKLAYMRPVQPIEFNRDYIDAKFIYYQNGYVEITKDEIKLLPYNELKGFIWESQILQRSIDLSSKIESRVVEKFLQLVSGEKEYPGRYKSLQTIIGYLLHDFCDYKLKMPLFTDSTIGDGNESNGRTGKTLFLRLVGHMVSSKVTDPTIKSYIEIGMKDFKADDKHKFSRVSHDTKLVVLNDLKGYFKLDTLYNAITDGLLVDRKNKDPFLTMVKLAATSNKTVVIDGRSSSDRVVEFEFSDHFNDRVTPQDEFNQWFFRDWNQKDWNDYDRIMIMAVHEFIKNKCVMEAPKQINLNKRKLKEQTSDDFMEFVKYDWQPEGNKEYDKKQLFSDFIEKYPDWNKLTSHRFTKWLKNLCNFSEEWKNYDKDKNNKRLQNQHLFILIPNDTDEIPF